MTTSKDRFEQALSLIRGCSAGTIPVKQFAYASFELTQDSFAIPVDFSSSSTEEDEIQQVFCALRSDCAQFQPDPVLYRELMKTAVSPNEFLDEEGLQRRVNETYEGLKRKGLVI